MQAAAAGKTASEFTEMLRSGDPGIEEAARVGVDITGNTGKGLGDGATMVGDGVGSVGTAIGGRGMDGRKGVVGAGQEVGKGLGEGVQGVGQNMGRGVGKGAYTVGDGVNKGLGGVGLGGWGRR